LGRGFLFCLLQRGFGGCELSCFRCCDLGPVPALLIFELGYQGSLVVLLCVELRKLILVVLLKSNEGILLGFKGSFLFVKNRLLFLEIVDYADVVIHDPAYVLSPRKKVLEAPGIE